MTQSCGTCRHWKRIQGDAGNCWAPVPFWYIEAGCATWASDGTVCAAWIPHTDNENEEVEFALGDIVRIVAIPENSKYYISIRSKISIGMEGVVVRISQITKISPPLYGVRFTEGQPSIWFAGEHIEKRKR